MVRSCASALLAFLPEVSSLVSVQSLVLIAVDRFGAVVVPLRSPLISRKLCPLFILATWIVAIAVASPNLFVYKLVENPGEMKCQNQWAKTFGEKSFVTYLLAGVSVFYYIPMILLVAVYSIILIKLKKQAHPGEQSVNAEEQRTKRNRNVLKMAIAIVLAFFLCWIPSYTLGLINQIGRLEKPETGIGNRNGNENRKRNRNRKRQQNRDSNVKRNRYKNRDIIYLKLF